MAASQPIGMFRIVPANKRTADVGDSFGSWTIIGEPFYAKPYRFSTQFAVAECKCGAVALVRLGAANHISSACVACRPKTGGKVKHGQHATRLYRIWIGIKARCCNPKNVNYKHYGARGITICDEWRESFLAFAEWAKANGYADNLSIDRIDAVLGYTPSNCRWATASQQQWNTRSNAGCTSAYKGVSWIARRKRWRVCLKHAGVRYHLGEFTSEEDAARAYDEKARELFGEFAHINFPQEALQ